MRALLVAVTVALALATAATAALDTTHLRYERALAPASSRPIRCRARRPDVRA